MLKKIAGEFIVGRRVILASLIAGACFVAAAYAQQAAPPASTGPIGTAVDNSKAPLLAFDVDPEPLKLPPRMNFGETLGIAIDSKGRIVVLNHPGTAKSGPIFGNATTNLLEFTPDGQYVGEIGEGVYGLAYGHSIRFDQHDNLWYVDKASNSVIKFNPQWRVTMNLGRRDEGYDSAFEHERPTQAQAKPRESYFHGPTDIAFDPDDNIFVSDGYTNSRIAKFDKNGNWLTSWGSFGSGGPQANENPGKINNPHNMQADRQGNIYVADRANRRIQVFDKNGKFLRFLFLNAPYDKTHRPTLGDMPDPKTRPDQTQPWTICISTTSTQYLFAIDVEPGRLYKMTLDGKIVGMAGISGRQVGQFNWAHAIACPSENVVWVADMNNWRIQKLTLKGPAR
jgi:DNA-binding beta-propeller fold protein YncE